MTEKQKKGKLVLCVALALCEQKVSNKKLIPNIKPKTDLKTNDKGKKLLEQ